MADRKSGPVTIKKYANRRLYNTATSTYVTLDNLAAMVREGTEFNVYDAKTGEDITRSVLTQIIMEAENSGTGMLPVPFLRQIIGFYGGNMDQVLGKYLEHSMQSFSANQEKMRSLMQSMTGGIFPLGNAMGSLEEMGKQNMAVFERTLKMFNPMEAGSSGAGQSAGERMKAESEKSLDELQKQLDELQRQIGDIVKGRR